MELKRYFENAFFKLSIIYFITFNTFSRTDLKSLGFGELLLLIGMCIVLLATLVFMLKNLSKTMEEVRKDGY